jgi:hypothetical protein
VIVADTRTFSSGKSPVRINQIPSRSIPKFLPAKLLVKAMIPPTLQQLQPPPFLRYYVIGLKSDIQFKTIVKAR